MFATLTQFGPNAVVSTKLLVKSAERPAIWFYFNADDTSNNSMQRLIGHRELPNESYERLPQHAAQPTTHHRIFRGTIFTRQILINEDPASPT